jgi:hypothetical protein
MLFVIFFGVTFIGSSKVIGGSGLRGIGSGLNELDGAIS